MARTRSKKTPAGCGPLPLVKGLFLLGGVFLCLPCGSGCGADPLAPAGGTGGRGFTVTEAADGLWLEQNGLPYCNGETGTEVLTLNGTWRFLEDPGDEGLDAGWQDTDRDISGWRTLEVPGVWNAVFEDLFHYKGVGWFAVDVETDPSPVRPVLSFGAVFLRCDVYVNGTRVGGHNGGYTAFWVDASGAWQTGRNRLTLRVSNRITDKTIPADTLLHHDSHGWWPYGGILRDVSLQDWPDAMAFRLNALYELSADRQQADLDFRVGIRGFAPEGTDVVLDLALLDPGGAERLRGSSAPVRVREGEVLHLQARGRLDPVLLWDVGTPRVYEVVLTLRAGADGRVLHTARHRTGFRAFEIRDGDFHLNGRRHVLRGINRHDDIPGRGSAVTVESVERDLDLIQGLGANHTRPGHYPVHPAVLAGCRDRGITVTEEIPVYQIALGQFSDPELFETAERQLVEMIERDRNNPAVILWSLSNEVFSMLPASGGFTRRQAEVARRWDPGRPLTAALLNPACMGGILPEFVAPEVDVVSINEYYGWYIGKPEDCRGCLQYLQDAYPDKPVVLSEFGAGAALGRRLDPERVGPEPLDDHSYSEEFQAWLLGIHLDAAHEAGLDGTLPWILADFHMEWKPTTGKPHPVADMNLKGLCDHGRSPKRGYDAVRSRYQDPGFLEPAPGKE